MKVFICDIDGTFFSHETYSIPHLDEVKLAFSKLVINNIPIIFATARVLEGCFSIIKTLDLDNSKTYCVSGNGSEIYYDKYLYESIVPLEMIKKVHDLSSKIDLAMAVDQKDYLLIEKFDAALEDDRLSLPIDLVLPHDFLSSIKYPVHKVSLTSDNEITEIFPVVYDALSSEVNVCKAGKDYIDITMPYHNKAYGVKKLLELLNIEDSKVYYIGDSHNDLELMAMADVAACVDNAIDLCKDICQIHVKSCEEGGIIDFIDWIISD